MGGRGANGLSRFYWAFLGFRDGAGAPLKARKPDIRWRLYTFKGSAMVRHPPQKQQQQKNSPLRIRTFFF